MEPSNKKGKKGTKRKNPLKGNLKAESKSGEIMPFEKEFRIPEKFRSIALGFASGRAQAEREKALRGGVKLTLRVEEGEDGRLVAFDTDLVTREERMAAAIASVEALEEIEDAEISPMALVAMQKAEERDFVGMIAAIAADPVGSIGFMASESIGRNPMSSIVGIVPLIGTFIGSMQAEERSGFSNSITQQIVEIGGDPHNVDDVFFALSNRDILEKAYATARRGASALATTEVFIEAMTLGFSKFLPKGVIHGLATLGSETIGETAGEVSRQIAVGEDVNLVSASLEGFTALGQSVATTVGHLGTRAALEKATPVSATLMGLGFDPKNLKSDEERNERVEALYGAIKELPAGEALKAISEIQRTVKDLSEEQLTSLTGISNMMVKRSRDALGLDPLSESVVRKWNKSIAMAIAEDLDKDALGLAQSLIDDPRPVKDTEQAGMAVAIATREQSYSESVTKAHGLRKQGMESEALRELSFSESIKNEIDFIQQASGLAGTEAGRTLASRKMLLNRNTFELVHVVREAEIQKGGPLKESEIFELKEATDLNKQLMADISNVRAEKERLRDGYLTRMADQEIRHLSRRLDKKKKIADIRQERANWEKEFHLIINEGPPMGISPKAAYALGRIALTYIQEGVVQTDLLVQKLMDKFPDLTREDALEGILSVEDDERKAVYDEARVKRGEALDKEEDLDKQLRDAMLKDPKKAEKVLAEMGLLQQQTYKSEPQRLAEIQAENDKLREQIRKGIDAPKEKQPKAKESPAIEKALAEQRELKTAKRLIRERKKLEGLTRDELAEMAADQAEKRRKRKLPPMTKELEEARVKLRISQKNIARIVFGKKKIAGRDIIPETNALFRTFMAGAEVSALMRQGIGMMVSHPVKTIWGSEFGVEGEKQHISPVIEAFRTYFSENRAEAINILLEDDANHVKRIEHGLEITTFGSLQDITRGEEMFASKLFKRIPSLHELFDSDRSTTRKVLTAPLSTLRAPFAGSERSFVSFLNFQRAAIFDQALDPALGLDPSDLDQFADSINKWTGRGKTRNPGMDIADYVLFAKKFTYSRFQAPVATARMLANPKLRMEAARQIGGMVALAASVMGMAKILGCQVGGDPKDSDFGKIICGNTRHDMFGGFQQVASLILRSMYGTLVAGELIEETRKIDVRVVNDNFAHYKMSPALTTAFDLATGEDVFGKDISAFDALVMNKFPLFLQDAADAARDGGLLKGAGALIEAGVGIGINTYGGALSSGKIKPIINAAGYKPKPSPYPEKVKEDKELSDQLDVVFELMMAKRIKASFGYMEELRKEKPKFLKPILQKYANDVRKIMRKHIGEGDISEADVAFLKKMASSSSQSE